MAKQLVNKSAQADLRAIKQLVDIVERVEQQSGAAPASPPPAFSAADEEVIAYLKAKMERDIRARIAAENAGASDLVRHPRESGGPEAEIANGGPDSRLRGSDE